MKHGHQAFGILFFAVGIGNSALAQSGPTGGFLLKSSNVVSPSKPSTTVEMWAWFDYIPGQAEMFSGTKTNLRASEGEWSNIANHFGIIVDPSPIVVGSHVFGMVLGQLHFPPAGIYANPSNPILLFSMDWSTTNFDKRMVSIETFDTQVFEVYINQQGSTANLPLSSIIEGSGFIKVVPAPGGAAAILSLACLAAARRRTGNENPAQPPVAHRISTSATSGRLNSIGGR